MRPYRTEEDLKAAYDRGYLITQHELEQTMQPVNAMLLEAERRGDRYRTLAITAGLVTKLRGPSPPDNASFSA